VEILNHWFGANGLGLNKDQFVYWSMDNEPDIWHGTHDDVMDSGLLPASEFIDKFVEVAKKARAIFPEIKICGPVTTNEWQWYKWGDESINGGGNYYCWLEYFLKRIAEEEAASGLKLLDVVDLHNYPSAASDMEALQYHRVYYDENYDYPIANGVKTINGGWDESQTKEYIFQRIEDWLLEYFGEDHDITIALSEWGLTVGDPNARSVVYGSMLGTFANHGVEFFTPWYWENGMWETLHLFSRYAKGYSVSSNSSIENTVSAYTSVNESADSMTVIIVNRDQAATKNVKVNLSGFTAGNGVHATLQLSALPSSETFISHTNNALTESTVAVSANSFTLSAPKLSTTAILLTKTETAVTGIENKRSLADGINIYPNPVSEKLIIRASTRITDPLEIIIYDQRGRVMQSIRKSYDGISPIEVNTSVIPNGLYFLSVRNARDTMIKRFVVSR